MTQSKWHKLTLTTVTPMFLGKFDSEDPREWHEAIPFPVQSLRGVLAYWLRALAGAHVGDDLGQLADVEAKVFGGARADGSGGPSMILLRSRKLIGVREFAPRFNDNKYTVGYLMGPGLYGAKPAARCVDVAKPLDLEVRNNGTAVDADLFLCALWALRTFGGIGARARRGFGTFSVSDRPLRVPCERFQAAWLYRDSAEDLTDVLSCVRDCLGQLGIAMGAHSASSQPSYPRFGLTDQKWHILGDVGIHDAENSEAALAWTSERLRAFRRDGEGNKNTAGWREIARPYIDGHGFSAPFRAGALGLPVVYTDKATEPGVDDRSAVVEPIVNGQSSRRASPLWLRVHGKGSTWWLRSLAFDATWLPNEGSSSLQIKGGKGVTRLPEQVRPPSRDMVRNELERWFSFASSTQNPA